MANPLVLPISSPIPLTYLVLVVLYVICGLILFSYRRFTTTDIVIFIAFVALLPSVFFSYNASVSIFKFALFYLGFSVFYFVFVKIDNFDNRAFALHSFKRILLINRILLVLSAIIFFAGLGYPRNETGFAGALNHPQSAGIYFGICALLEFFKVMYNKGSRFQSLLFLGLASTFVVMSESRTAFVAMLLAFGVFYFVRLFRGGDLTFKKKIYWLLVLGLLTLIAVPLLGATFVSVIAKGGDSANLIDAYQESRFFLVYASYLNFLDSPLYGIGFQVSNGLYGHFDMVVHFDPVLGLPVKASIEKGVFVVALLEESGLLGFLAFSTIILALLKIASWSPMALAMTGGVLLFSLGESMLFSFGGLGFICWFYIFYFCTLANSLEQQLNR